MIFEQMEHHDYEQLVFCQDNDSGLKAIICIHDTTLGPALGGTRFWDYATEEEAIVDVLRLARGMTYKNAAAGLNIGGGKAVIIGDPKKIKSEQLFRSFGRFVNSLNGRYITAEDVNTTVQDMDYIHLETEFVTGISESYGSSGNPSPKTALGVYTAMKRVAQEVFGTDSLEGRTIAVQGVGTVAYTVCEYLHKEGAHLIVTDINEESVQRAVDNFGAESIGVDEIYDVEADIYAPCALGATLNDDTIPRLKVKAVCGAANNQLASTVKHSEMLDELGILYAPDFVVNSGGVINVSDELEGYNEERAVQKVEGIYDQMGKIFDIAKRDNISTALAANTLAEERIAAIKNLKSKFSQNPVHTLSRRL